MPNRYFRDVNFRPGVSKFKVEFDNELKSLMHHSTLIKRPFLGLVANRIYAYKFRAKSYAPYLYAGETEQNYFNYRSFQTSLRDKVAADIIAQKQLEASNPSKQRLILGLECSFNDSCAAVVSSTGKVLSNTK